MFCAKLLTTVCGLTLAFAVLLGLRQQRLELMHEMSVLHRQMDADRKQTWDLQTRIAENARPEAIRLAAERVGLDLRSAVAAWPVPADAANPPRRMVRAHAGGEDAFMRPMPSGSEVLR